MSAIFGHRPEFIAQVSVAYLCRPRFGFSQLVRHQNDVLAALFKINAQQVGHPAARHGFVDLRQLTGKYDLAIAQNIVDGLERRSYPMRRLEEDERPRLSREGLEPRRSLYAPSR